MPSKDVGLVFVVLESTVTGETQREGFGAYLGPHFPIELEPGVSWRDALAEETARVLALEAALANLGWEVRYPKTVEEVAAMDCTSLTVNEEAWDLNPS